jgi:hypothetical protein
VVLIFENRAPGFQFEKTSAPASDVASEGYWWHRFYCPPAGQSRPLRNAGAAYTRSAAGIKMISQLVPPHRAASPSTISRKVEVIEFLEARLICKNPRGYSSQSERSQRARPLGTCRQRPSGLSFYPYIFSWSRWKPMRATPRQIMVKASKTSQWFIEDSWVPPPTIPNAS